MIICMLIGFFISPTILKSQLIQPNNPISLLLELDTQNTFNNCFSLDYFFESDWSSVENEIFKGDSLKNNLEIQSKMKSTKNSTIQLNRSSSKKIKKKNFRNMSVIIQTRI